MLLTFDLTDAAMHKLSRGGLLAGSDTTEFYSALDSTEACEHHVNLGNRYSSVARNYDIESLGSRCVFLVFFCGFLFSE